MSLFKAKCPINYYRKEWIEEAGNFIFKLFGKEYLLEKKQIIPNESFFTWKYQAVEEDADIILEKLCYLMDININLINLMFYDQNPGQSVLNKIPHSKENEQGFTGLYHSNYSEYHQIDIEIQQLNNPISLVATMAHELCHQKLLGERRITKNDEHLTDLLTIFFGLGLFSANSVILYNKYQTIDMAGWSISRKGYLSEDDYGYALALWTIYRDDDIKLIKQFLVANVKDIFKKSIKFVKKTEHKYW